MRRLASLSGILFPTNLRAQVAFLLLYAPRLSLPPQPCLHHHSISVILRILFLSNTIRPILRQMKMNRPHQTLDLPFRLPTPRPISLAATLRISKGGRTQVQVACLPTINQTHAIEPISLRARHPNVKSSRDLKIGEDIWMAGNWSCWTLVGLSFESGN